MNIEPPKRPAPQCGRIPFQWIAFTFLNPKRNSLPQCGSISRFYMHTKINSSPSEEPLLSTFTFTLIDITSVFTFTFIAIIIIFTFPFLGITLSWEHLLLSPWKENPLPQRRLIGSQHKTSQNISQLNTKHQKFSHKEEKILHKILATSAPTAKTSFQQNSDNYLGTVFIQVKQKFLRHMNMF